MNTTLSARPSHDQQLNTNIHYDQTSQPIVVRRVKLLDRLALHLGLALIKWGRRPLEHESRERRANRVEQAVAREGRLVMNERTARLLLPIR